MATIRQRRPERDDQHQRHRPDQRAAEQRPGPHGPLDHHRRALAADREGVGVRLHGAEHPWPAAPEPATDGHRPAGRHSTSGCAAATRYRLRRRRLQGEARSSRRRVGDPHLHLAAEDGGQLGRVDVDQHPLPESTARVDSAVASTGSAERKRVGRLDGDHERVAGAHRTGLRADRQQHPDDLAGLQRPDGDRRTDPGWSSPTMVSTTSAGRGPGCRRCTSIIVRSPAPQATSGATATSGAAGFTPGRGLTVHRPVLALRVLAAGSCAAGRLPVCGAGPGSAGGAGRTGAVADGITGGVDRLPTVMSRTAASLAASTSVAEPSAPRV